MKTNKRIAILTFVMSAASHYSLAQDTALIRSSDWTMYAVSGRLAMSAPIDSLLLTKSIKLDASLMKQFLKSAAPWSKEKYSVWMGAFATTANIDGKLRKFVLSSYGGFFYDSYAKQYFEIAEENKKDWHEFLNESAEALDTASGKKNVKIEEKY